MQSLSDFIEDRILEFKIRYQILPEPAVAEDEPAITVPSV
jgi:hypothetical protein